MSLVSLPVRSYLFSCHRTNYCSLPAVQYADITMIPTPQSITTGLHLRRELVLGSRTSSYRLSCLWWRVLFCLIGAYKAQTPLVRFALFLLYSIIVGLPASCSTHRSRPNGVGIFCCTLLDVLLQVVCYLRNQRIRWRRRSLQNSRASNVSEYLQGGPKSKPDNFCNNFVYCQPIFIIFDTHTLEEICNQ